MIFTDECIKKELTRYNEGKPKLSLVDLSCFTDAAHVLEQGIEKYGRNNWQLGGPASEILDSLLRHVACLQKGEWLDSESGLPHVGHIQCNAMMLGNKNNTNDLTKKEDEI